MDNLLNTLFLHLMDKSETKNQEIINNYEQFRSIINDKQLDGGQKAHCIEQYLRNMKLSQQRSYSEKKPPITPSYSNYNESQHQKPQRSNSFRFNNSIVLVETKLFSNKFQERTNEIEQMLQNYEKGL